VPNEELRLDTGNPGGYKVVSATPGGDISLRTPFGELTGSRKAFHELGLAVRAAWWAGGAPNRTLYIRETLRTRAQEQAKGEGREYADVLSEAFDVWLEGGLELEKPQRAPRRTPGADEAPPKPTQVSSVRKYDDEWRRMLDKCEADTKRLGWAVNPSRVASSRQRVK
jgi:hypothetical protein